MSIRLKLPEELDPDEEVPFDRIIIFRRATSTTVTQIGDVPIGTATFTDSAGKINDEYHIIFRDSINGISSLPSSIYRALNPTKQLIEPDPPVAVILELDTTAPTVDTDFVAIYRRKPSEFSAIRIGLVPIGQQFFEDPDGLPGDIYHSTFIDSTNGLESQPSIFVTANANSGLVVVSGRFEDPSGEASESFKTTAGNNDVEALLILPDEIKNRTPAAQGQVIGTFKTSVFIEKITEDEAGNPVDPPVSTGRWSMTLIPNDLITPNNTFYEFVYRGHRYFKKVNSANGLAQNFALLEDKNPRFVQL